MRICLVRHFAAADDHTGDLGTKQVGFQIAARVSKRHETMQVDIKKPLSWTKIRDFSPQVIHFILSPTISGLVAARVCGLFGAGAKTVLSAPNPDLRLWRLGAMLRPDLVLIQSHESEAMFRRMGCETRFLPNGVDVQRFVPVSPARKARLREKYGVAAKRLVILHVGPIIRRRNVDHLAALQSAEHQVIVVGRKPVDAQVHRALLEAGCIVRTDYVEHIEELYALSDCYVFPTPPMHRGASIEMPLSVLEAMSCNLPVFATRFGALPRVFEEGKGLAFVGADDDLARMLHPLEDGLESRARDQVLQYSWGNIVDSLESTYEEVSGGVQR